MRNPKSEIDLVLGIDLGTTNVKACLFGRDGRLRGLGRVAVRTGQPWLRQTAPQATAPESGRCELPAERFWEHLRMAIAAAMREAQAQPCDIRAVGYSSQASSFILLDANDEPLTPLILWPDRRAAEIDPNVAALWARPDFTATTGLGVPLGAEFTPCKLRWFAAYDRGLWRRARRIMTISDYLIFSLTGQAAGDAGTAALLGMMDARRLAWWPEAVEAAGVSPEQLSRLLRPGSRAGALTAGGAQLLGAPAGIPLVAGSLDHHVAAIGAGVDSLGEMSESTGTVTACIRHADSWDPKPNCVTGPGLREGQFYELAFDENGAGVLDWYRRRHAPQFSVAELLQAAGEVPPDADGLNALPKADRYEGLVGFVGRRASHGHGHFARAILNSTARTLREILGRLCPEGPPRRVVATGGGARSDLWLQVQADCTGAEMVAVDCEEPACQGAAMLAAVGAGWFADVGQAGASWIRGRKVFSPSG